MRRAGGGPGQGGLDQGDGAAATSKPAEHRPAFSGCTVCTVPPRLVLCRLDAQIIPALGQLRVRELTVGTIHRHLQAVAQMNGPGLAKTTRAVLSGICAFAAQRDALAAIRSEMPGPARSTEPRKRPVSLSLAQAKQLRALTYDEQAVERDLSDLVAFILATACRIGEACAMTWDAIDLETGIVEVRGTKTTVALRTVPVPLWCRDAARTR